MLPIFCDTVLSMSADTNVGESMERLSLPDDA